MMKQILSPVFLGITSDFQDLCPVIMREAQFPFKPSGFPRILCLSSTTVLPFIHNFSKIKKGLAVVLNIRHNLL